MAARLPDVRIVRGSRSLGACVMAFAVLALFIAGSSAAEEPAADNAAERIFFEETIQPLLVAHCYECHSHESGEASGGLVLDSRSGWAVGGDSGPALVVGKPEESLLVRAIGYDEPDLQMPPDGKLDAAAVASLTDWVRRGAFDPRVGSGGTGKAATIDLEAGRNFWSYRPIVDPPPPTVRNVDWPSTAIDRFVLSRLEQEGLAPAEEADRATLVRRLYLDLTGLPPTPEEIDAFVADDAPDAWERLVDRLLASPAYGERFARRWLDVVRYGESMTLRGLVFHEAWRFRDYVIQSYDEDRPWNRVLAEHVAGDLLPAASFAEMQRGQIATSFLVLGNKNLEEQDKKALDLDAADEQLDTLGKAFLGQTIGCARCHDHKFDPIPTRDYYAMAGILLNTQTLIHSNVSGWTENPLPLPPEEEARFAAHEAETKRLQTLVDDAKKYLAGLTKGGAVQNGTISPGSLAGAVVDDEDATQVGIWKHSTFLKPFVGVGYVHDENVGKGEKTLTLTAKLPRPGTYEVRIAYAPGPDRASNVPVTIFSAEGEKTVMLDQRREPAIDGKFVSLGAYLFEKDGQSFVLVSNEATDGHVTLDAVQFVPVDAPNDPAGASADAEALAVAERIRQEEVELRKELKELEADLKAHQATMPKRPTAMSVRELPSDKIGDARIRVRGMPHNLGDVAPRGFLQVATVGPMPTFPQEQSGRRELGKWLASKENPLPARVYANRVWLWLVGEGIVASPDNFGASGELPSHPELLDYLASRLQANSWSTKELVREIVLSRTYRMSSAGDPAAEAADPENRLIRRANVKRTDAETLRDSMLLVAGRLDRARFGTLLKPNVSADYDYVATSDRRTIYLPQLRNSTPEIVKIFDGADPSAVTGRRPKSASAAQALFLLNDDFVAQQAQLTAKRLIADAAGFETRLDDLYRSALGRTPLEGEASVARTFFGIGTETETSRANDVARWTTFCRALFASADFRRTY
jgi:hypothetical protein